MKTRGEFYFEDPDCQVGLYGGWYHDNCPNENDDIMTTERFITRKEERCPRCNEATFIEFIHVLECENCLYVFAFQDEEYVGPCDCAL